MPENNQGLFVLRRFRFLPGSRMLLLKVSAKLLLVITIRLIPNLPQYRTQFHIGQTYNLSESTVCRTITKIENALIQSGQFTLPGKKSLQENDMAIEIILVDATEQAIERPQKNRNHIIAARKNIIPKKPK